MIRSSSPSPCSPSLLSFRRCASSTSWIR